MCVESVENTNVEFAEVWFEVVRRAPAVLLAKRREPDWRRVRVKSTALPERYLRDWRSKRERNARAPLAQSAVLARLEERESEWKENRARRARISFAFAGRLRRYQCLTISNSARTHAYTYGIMRTIKIDFILCLIWY